MKFKIYKGETLTDVLVTYKIDGVRAHKINGQIQSRAGKPLYNINMSCEVAEIYCGSWEDTITAVRTQNYIPVSEEYIYSLLPEVDERLVVGFFAEVSDKDVQVFFDQALNKGYEGLVLRSEGKLYKVKGEETYDVPITAVIPGKGKHTGKMGALMTPMGKVGTGFTDVQRKESWNINEIIEVKCMELTPDGKFRHPRFMRRREDKV